MNDTSGFYPTTLNTGTGDDYTQVYATGDNTLNINGQNGTDTVYFGGSSVAPLGMQGLNGTINVGNALGLDRTWSWTTRKTPSARLRLLFNDGTNGSGHRAVAGHDQLYRHSGRQHDRVRRQRGQYLHGRRHAG